jgi:hypothetical protein
MGGGWGGGGGSGSGGGGGGGLFERIGSLFGGGNSGGSFTAAMPGFTQASNNSWLNPNFNPFSGFGGR